MDVRPGVITYVFGVKIIRQFIHADLTDRQSKERCLIFSFCKEKVLSGDAEISLLVSSSKANPFESALFIHNTARK